MTNLVVRVLRIAPVVRARFDQSREGLIEMLVVDEKCAVTASRGGMSPAATNIAGIGTMSNNRKLPSTALRHLRRAWPVRHRYEGHVHRPGSANLYVR
jgi:hypothetical protein